MTDILETQANEQKNKNFKPKEWRRLKKQHETHTHWTKMIRNTFLSLIINEFNEFYHIFGVKYNGPNKTTKHCVFFLSPK